MAASGIGPARLGQLVPLRDQCRQCRLDAAGNTDWPDPREDQVHNQIAQHHANHPVARNGQVKARSGTLDDAQVVRKRHLEACVGNARRALRHPCRYPRAGKHQQHQPAHRGE